MKPPTWESFLRLFQPSIRSRDRPTPPSLLSVALAIANSRIDKLDEPTSRPKLRAAAFAFSWTLMLTGIIFFFVGLARTMPIIRNESVAGMAMLASSPFAFSSGMAIFARICSMTTYATVSRIVRTVGRKTCLLCLISSFIMSGFTLFVFTYGIITQEEFVRRHETLVVDLMAIQFLALAIALMALATIPPILAIGRPVSAPHLSQAALSCWYLSVLALLTMGLFFATELTAQAIIPVAAFIGLLTFVLVRIETHRRNINEITHELTDALTEVYTEATATTRRRGRAKTDQEIIEALLRLQNSWTEDPATKFLGTPIRVKVDFELCVVLDYVVSRLCHTPLTRAVESRQRFLERHLGATRDHDLVVLLVDLARDLREQSLGRSPAAPRGLAAISRS